MTTRTRTSDRINATPGGWVLAGVLLAAVCVWPISAGGQVSVGTSTPGGSKVGMGVISDDPAADAEAQRERRQKRFAELIAQARAHVEAQEWLPARKRLDEARRNVTDKAADLPPLRELYQALETQGQAMLSQANRAYLDQDYGTSLAGYREIAKVFKGLPSADQAADALSAAAEDENVQMHLADQAAMELVRNIDTVIAVHRKQAAEDASSDEPPPEVTRAEAIRALPVDKQVEVVGLMESIVERFSATPTGAQIKGELAALQADEAMMVRINAARGDRKADQALKRAKMYHTGGMLEKALRYYREVVADHPASDAADEAREAIAQLEAEAGASDP